MHCFLFFWSSQFNFLKLFSLHSFHIETHLFKIYIYSEYIHINLISAVKSVILRGFAVRAKLPSPIHYWRLACEPTPSLTVRKWPNSSLRVSLCSSQLLCRQLPRFSLGVKVRLHITTPVFTRLSLPGALLLDSSNTSQRVWRSRNQSASDKTDVQPWHMLNHRIRRNDCDDPVEYAWVCNPQQAGTATLQNQSASSGGLKT